MKYKSGDDSLKDWRHRRNDTTLNAVTATARQRLLVILLVILTLLNRLVLPTIYPSTGRPYYPIKDWHSIFGCDIYEYLSTIISDRYTRKHFLSGHRSRQNFQRYSGQLVFFGNIVCDNFVHEGFLLNGLMGNHINLIIQ